MAYITIQDAIKNMSFSKESTKGGLIRGRGSYKRNRRLFMTEVKLNAKLYKSRF